MRFWLFSIGLLSASSSVCKWKLDERADPQSLVSLFFALPYSNKETTSELLKAVSDPSSSQYRMFPSADYVSALMAPLDEGRAHVESFMSKKFPLLSGQWHGFGHNYHLTLPVGQVEAMLHTECHVYRYVCGAVDNNITTIRTVNQSFPLFELSPVLAYVGGVTQFPLRHFGIQLPAPLEEPKKKRNSIYPLQSQSFIHFSKVNTSSSSSSSSSSSDASAAHHVKGTTNENSLEMRSFHKVNSFPNDLLTIINKEQSHSSNKNNINDRLSRTNNAISVAPTTTTTNPFLKIYGDDGKVSMQVQVTCPDGTPATTYGMCGTAQFQSMRIRYKGGSLSQTSSDVDLSVCGQYSGEPDVCSCLFGLVLAANYVRYAFGVDIKFDNSQSYSYDLTSQYVVGEPAKSPRFFRRFYDIPDVLVTKSPSNYQAVVALTLTDGSSGFFSPSDLRLFYNTFDVVAPVQTVDMKGATNDPSRVDVETQLDIQWITAIGEGSHSSVWHASNYQSFESVIEQIQTAAAANQPIPKVLSISYGAPESGQSSSIPNLEEGFKSLGLLGISVLVASGDSGAFWDDCSGPQPGYPATSQYVTSVGATQLVAQLNSAGVCQVREAACSLDLGAGITTGGGFSQVISLPDWQRDAVNVYLNVTTNTALAFDATKRGYPDIAVFGHNYNIVSNAQITAVDGTSASSPAFAGILTLINDVLLAQNQSLGFLNPLLYQIFANHSDAFSDITYGSNGCTRESCCSSGGFSAAKGWDPVSGVGSPIFSKFAKYAGASYEGSSSPPSFTDPDCTVPVVGPYSFWSTWMIIAVVAGSLVVLCMLIGCISMACCKRARRRNYSLQDPLLNPNSGGERRRPVTPNQSSSRQAAR